MSPLCGIFPNRVFERPYCDLTTFSQVSCTLKLKNTGRKTLKTSLAAHREKTRPKSHLGAKTTKNRSRLSCKLTTWPRPKIFIFQNLHFFATHGHQDRKKQVPGIQFFRKVDKSNPIGTQSCQNQSKLQFFSIQSVPFSRWGAFL